VSGNNLTPSRRLTSEHKFRFICRIIYPAYLDPGRGECGRGQTTRRCRRRDWRSCFSYSETRCVRPTRLLWFTATVYVGCRDTPTVDIVNSGRLGNGRINSTLDIGSYYRL